MSRNLVRRPRPPSYLNVTQTPTTRTALIVRRHRIQHLVMPTWGHPLKKSVHSIEACYETPVGHFQVKYEARRKVEVQHSKHVNQRRVGRPRQTSTKAKRNEERRVESKIHKQLHQRRTNMRLKHKRRTSLGTDQRQRVCKKNPR
jgi:hypothetical protein